MIGRLARIAWSNLWRNPRRTAITVSALALGLVMLAFTLSIMAGMTRDLIEQGTGLLLGHIEVHAAGYRPDRSIFDTIPGDGRALAERLRKLPDVRGAAPRAIGYGLVSAGENSVGAELLGVVPAAESSVSSLLSHVAEGASLSTGNDDTSRAEVLIGKRLARTLAVRPGDEIVILTQAADGSLGNDLYRLAGCFETGVDTIDSGLVVMHLDALQNLLVLPPARLHEIALRTDDATKATAVAARLSAELGNGLDVAAWPTLAPQIAGYLAMSDGWLWLLYLIVLGLACIAVLNTMLMAVFERFREFGVLAAIGMRPLHVILLVAFEVLGLAVVSLVAAAAIGAPLLRWEIEHGIDLRSMTSGYTMSGVAMSPIMRGAWDPGSLVTAALLLIVFALLSGLYPAVRATRADPAALTRGEPR
jgi:putative ABC transport system permease protein